MTEMRISSLSHCYYSIIVVYRRTRMPSPASACVNLVFASSNVVVLTGETIPQVQVNLRSDNHMIWQAVNQIKAQGYSIQSVSITGSGIEANPYEYHVVIAK